MSTAGQEWAWLRARARRTPRSWRRVGAVLAAIGAILTGAAVPAWAATDIPAALSWITLTDSRGISVWSYGLSLDGGGVTSPTKVVYAFIAQLMWQVYRAVVVLAIWFLDWVLGFSWLDWIATPVLALSDALRGVVAQVGLAPLFLTILAAVAGMAIIRGRFALGLFEVFMGCAVAAVAVGGLSNPVGLVTGNSGYIMQARDLGIEISAGLANNGDTSGSADQLRTQIGQTLADTFIRTPHSLVNYGRPIAGDACESTYDDALRQSATENDDSYVRDKVADCNDAMGDYAANPNAGMDLSAGILVPASLLVLGFALLLAGALLLAAVRVLYESLKLVVTLVTGILPGGARGSLWQGIGHLVMALATMTFTTVFLTGYLLVLQSVFNNSGSGGTPVMATFVFVDVLIVVGAILFWRGRQRLQEGAARLAALLSTRPGGGGPSKLPTPQQGLGLAAVGGAVQHRLLSRKIGSVADARAEGMAEAAGGGGGGGGGRWVGAGTPGASTTSAFTRVRSVPRRGGGTSPDAAPDDGPPSPGPGPGPGGGSKSPAVLLGRQLAAGGVKKAAKGILVRAAIHGVAAASTGGLSAAVTAADAARTARQVNNARRVIVAGRLAKAAIAAPQPSRGAAPSSHPAAQGGPTGDQGGYEQVQQGGQTILVPPRAGARRAGGGQMPPRPPAAAPGPQNGAAQQGGAAVSSGAGQRSSRTMPTARPAGVVPPAPTPPPATRPAPGPGAPSDRLGPPAESAAQLHAHLQAFRGSRRRRDGA